MILIYTVIDMLTSNVLCKLCLTKSSISWHVLKSFKREKFGRLLWINIIVLGLRKGMQSCVHKLPLCINALTKSLLYCCLDRIQFTLGLIVNCWCWKLVTELNGVMCYEILKKNWNATRKTLFSNRLLDNWWNRPSFTVD